MQTKTKQQNITSKYVRVAAVAQRGAFRPVAILQARTCRGDNFPFQKIAFSVWKNSEFRFKGLSKWKFCLAIDTVHKNSVYERNTNYESGYFRNFKESHGSVSHCDIACAARLNDSRALQSKLASYRMYTVQGMPSLDCAL